MVAKITHTRKALDQPLSALSSTGGSLIVINPRSLRIANSFVLYVADESNHTVAYHHRGYAGEGFNKVNRALSMCGRGLFVLRERTLLFAPLHLAGPRRLADRPCFPPAS